ncbi:hypothetical protein HBI42_219000 [Parastagonospora nodorum]|nr:hypothetical protein HBI47_219250 [Parastagonospora nodorum]KAH6201684.1 hypothetical protein HBI43_216550 [Parastagonospora nodorum]KAH6243361.1 hypothetical protein HBI42_219000 [Parastagonospora nodorum]KAH6445306.1 hypothetical protein HBI57_233130 [Parastagonospora nodorum]KAH6453182.1 hypothetical protein HBI58_206800 [Parastagonospora nodorum]
MSANRTPFKGELRGPVPAGASLETPRNRRGASRRNTPTRSGGEEMVDADANAGAVREEMADALEPPAHAQSGQSAQAGQDGAANVRGGEEMEGEEGLPSGNDPLPPPLNNRDRLQDSINVLWALGRLLYVLMALISALGLLFTALMVLLWALMARLWSLITFPVIHLTAQVTSLKRRRPKLFWSLLFALLLLLLAGFISMRSAPRPLRLRRNMDIDYVVSAPMSQEQEAEQLVQIKEWTRKMREMRGKGADWEDVDWENAEITWGDEMD